MSKRHIIFIIAAFFAMTFLASSCAPKKKLKVEEKPKEEVKQEPEEKVEVTTPTVEPGIRITQDWSDVPALSVVQFAFDSAQLDDANRATLKKNVAVLKKLPSTVTIRVEGHCDNRGTIEYNIALGERRAKAVINFYAASGIARSRLKTISFGHERPLCTDATEVCWAKNRRCATKVKADQPITIKEEDLK